MRVIRGNQRTLGVGARLDALARLVATAEGRLPAPALEPAREVLRRAAARFGMSAEHTVVILGGATGVGKSSLFNALVGIGLSPVAVRRPTTTQAIACVWEADRLAEARPLLDRLGVETRRQLTRDSALDRSPVRDPLGGLVLVDLPDHDSAVREHQVEVDQAVGLADVLVWVTDPQKYADASWHDRYLKALAHHADIMLIVLNQIDRLPAEAVAECTADLARLVEQDGLTGIPVIAVSARTREGLDELRRALTKRVSGRRAAADRLAADVDRVAERLSTLLVNPSAPEQDDGAASVSDAARAEVMDGLRAAAGVASLADAVSERIASRGEAAVSTPLRALSFLREFGAGGASAAAPRGASRRSLDGSSGGSLRELIRAVADPVGEAPAPVPVDRAALDTVLSRLADAATAALPPDWGRALRAQITGSRRKVADRIDAALAAGEIDARPPARHILVRTGHAALLALTALFAALCFVPGFPYPLGIALAALALLGSVVLDFTARRAARRSAVAAGQVAVGQLSVELAAVAQDELFGPIAEELSRYRSALTDFKAVRDG
ncbi:50S ribosome-binding GTPase [Actinocrinis puniceicyclus]|uniref:50S ribosome-binding GTPase n=1 Tax=Actinocrinis puniceicyclus TaxID=977794 RepID=A0A8J7WKD1_9ACTN|nr:GTPase [Actinocrinis puniceicyclus]MBS2963901.1 50S ribosome-binding GTPase [Actinocrinis puniceicyclus]